MKELLRAGEIIEITSGCGPAVMSSIAKDFGFDISQKELAQIMNTDFDGTSHDDMEAGGKWMGFITAQTNLDLDGLNDCIQRGCAVVVNWMSGPNFKEDGHYSQLLEAEKDYVIIKDLKANYSLIGIMDKQEFESLWFDIVDDEKSERWSLVLARDDRTPSRKSTILK